MCLDCGSTMIRKYGHKDHQPKQCDKVYLAGICKDLE
jgi:hypothetical protein